MMSLRGSCTVADARGGLRVALCGGGHRATVKHAHPIAMTKLQLYGRISHVTFVECAYGIRDACDGCDVRGPFSASLPLADCRLKHSSRKV
jgi:hypothetical protein